ncbi:MAG: cytochrome P450 [Solimonas sp.]
MRGNPNRLNAFVEENLRLFPTNTLLANKIAMSNIEFCGVPFREGEQVIVPIPSPNRDPRVFERPDEIDLYRKPQRHFSFSLGSHFCLGQALARAQLQAYFDVLSRTISSVDLLENEITWTPYAAITSLKSLRLRLNP